MSKLGRRIIEDLMVERIEKNRLIAVSEMSIEELTDAFTKGYRLVSPEAAKDDVPDDLRIVPKNGGEGLRTTLDKAIKHEEEAADKNEREKQKWERWLEHDNDNRAVAEKESCELCAKEHRQLAEWLKDYKRMKEQEPCEDAISRADVKKYLSAPDANGDRVIYESDLDLLPPVTPQPKTGRWIAYEVRLPDRTILNYRCSACGRKLIGYSTETLSEAPFCHCGAKMVEGAIRDDRDKSKT